MLLLLPSGEDCHRLVSLAPRFWNILKNQLLLISPPIPTDSGHLLARSRGCLRLPQLLPQRPQQKQRPEPFLVSVRRGIFARLYSRVYDSRSSAGTGCLLCLHLVCALLMKNSIYPPRPSSQLEREHQQLLQLHVLLERGFLLSVVVHRLSFSSSTDDVQDRESIVYGGSCFFPRR
jgi:hypothetical protein